MDSKIQHSSMMLREDTGRGGIEELYISLMENNFDLHARENVHRSMFMIPKKNGTVELVMQMSPFMCCDPRPLCVQVLCTRRCARASCASASPAITMHDFNRTRANGSNAPLPVVAT